MNSPLILVDFRSYTNGIRVQAMHAKPLYLDVMKAAPKKRSSEVNAALADVGELAESVQIVLDDRDSAAGPAIRPSFDACQSSWIGLIGAIEAKTRIAPEVSAAGKEAEALLGNYFPDGASFTRADARGFWSEAERRLNRMERSGDVKRITAMVGEDLVESVKTTTDALREVLNLGATTRDPEPAGDALREMLVRYGRALGKYGRVMAARVDENDAASVAEFRAAMAPIDAYRAGRASGGEESEDAPEAPQAPAGGSPVNGGGPFTQ